MLAIRFFGTDAEYDKIDAESVWWMQPSSWFIAMPLWNSSYPTDVARLEAQARLVAA